MRFRKYLTGKKYWSDKKETELQDEFKAEMDKQVASFEARTEFKMDAAFDNVFGTTHDVIEQQRAEFLSESAKEDARG